MEPASREYRTTGRAVKAVGPTEKENGMLCLGRKAGEVIVVDGPCRIVVVRTRSDQVRLGIEADCGVKILRGELVSPEKDDGEQ